MGTPSKTPKKKAPIWEHFTLLDDDKAECNHCRKQYVYAHGTGNYWTHLENKHGICRPHSKIQQGVDAAEKRSQMQPKIDTKFKEMKKYEKTSERYQDLTRSLAKLFIIEMLPLSKVEKDCWRKFASLMDPRYSSLHFLN